MPAFPGAIGHAVNITHGSGRHTTPAATIVKVTNLNSTGAGSLAAAVALSGPRIIVFEVAGIINVGQYLTIDNSYCWIAGCTAPSPGITLRQTCLRARAQNIFIEHIRFIATDEGTNPTKDSRDCLTVSSSSMYFKNCTFVWSIDELMDCGTPNPASTITFDRCLFAEPLKTGGHPEGDHDYGVLLYKDGQHLITFHKCVGATMAERWLRAYNGFTIEKINCVGYNMYGNAGWNNLTNAVGSTPTKQLFDLIGCYYKQPASLSASNIYAVQADRGPNHADTRYHVAGVICGNRTSDAQAEWDAVKTGTTSTQINETDDKSVTPVASSGTITASSAVDAYADLITNGNVGSRPEDRKANSHQPDTRILNDVATGVARANGTMASLGGFPTYNSASRTLTAPASPNTVQPSGYTVAEEWVTTYREGVEQASGGAGEFDSAIKVTRTTQTWGVSADSVVLPVTVTTPASAFVRLTNTNSANLADAATSAISYNDDEMFCRVGSIVGNDVTISRPSTGDNVDCISALETLEALYPGNANSFEIVFEGTVAMTTVQLTKDSTALTGITTQAHADQCVVILKGMDSSSTIRNWDRVAPTFAFVESSPGVFVARVTRSANNSSISANYDIAVLKMGANYNVEYFTHTIAAKGTDEEITITDAVAWTSKFIVSYHRPVSGNFLCCDVGWTSRPGSAANKVYNRVRSTAVVNGGIITGWVISNPELLVQHINSITGGAADFDNAQTTQSYALIAITDLARASVWCYADSSDTAQNYTRFSRNYRLTSTTALEKREGRPGAHTGDFAAAIVTWPAKDVSAVVTTALARAKAGFAAAFGFGFH